MEGSMGGVERLGPLARSLGETLYNQKNESTTTKSNTFERASSSVSFLSFFSFSLSLVYVNVRVFVNRSVLRWLYGNGNGTGRLPPVVPYSSHPVPEQLPPLFLSLCAATVHASLPLSFSKTGPGVYAFPRRGGWVGGNPRREVGCECECECECKASEPHTPTNPSTHTHSAFPLPTPVFPPSLIPPRRPATAVVPMPSYLYIHTHPHHISPLTAHRSLAPFPPTPAWGRRDRR